LPILRYRTKPQLTEVVQLASNVLGDGILLSHVGSQLVLFILAIMQSPGCILP
jgi:hypothetical protein